MTTVIHAGSANVVQHKPPTKETSVENTTLNIHEELNESPEGVSKEIPQETGTVALIDNVIKEVSQETGTVVLSDNVVFNCKFDIPPGLKGRAMTAASKGEISICQEVFNELGDKKTLEGVFDNDVIKIACYNKQNEILNFFQRKNLINDEIIESIFINASYYGNQEYLTWIISYCKFNLIDIAELRFIIPRNASSSSQIHILEFYEDYCNKNNLKLTESKKTPLYYAAKHQRYGCIHWWLIKLNKEEFKANIQTFQKQYCKSIKAFELIIAKCNEYGFKYIFSKEAICFYTINNYVNILEYAFSEHIKGNVEFNYDENAIDYIANSNKCDEKVLDFYLSKSNTHNFKLKYSYRAFNNAIQCNRLDIIQWWIASGLSIVTLKNKEYNVDEVKFIEEGKDFYIEHIDNAMNESTIELAFKSEEKTFQYLMTNCNYFKRNLEACFVYAISNYGKNRTWFLNKCEDRTFDCSNFAIDFCASKSEKDSLYVHKKYNIGITYCSSCVNGLLFTYSNSIIIGFELLERAILLFPPKKELFTICGYNLSSSQLCTVYRWIQKKPHIIQYFTKESAKNITNYKDGNCIIM